MMQANFGRICNISLTYFRDARILTVAKLIVKPRYARSVKLVILIFGKSTARLLYNGLFIKLLA